MRGPTVANPTVERSSAVTAVVTPQAVLLEFRTAGIGSRVLAKLIDLAAQLVLLILVALVSGFAAGSASFIIGAVGIFLVIFVYPATEAVMNGQTLGKRALSIRVITADGGPIRFRHAAIRSLIGFIEFFVLLPGGSVALVSALLTKRSQRVGDLVAETLVIRDKIDLTQPVFFNPPVGAEQVALNLDTTRLTHPQYGVLRQFVLRSWELDPQTRIELAQDLCEKLARVGIVQPVGIDASLFISAVVFAHQRRYASTGPAIGSLAPPTVPPVAMSAPSASAVRAPLPPPPVRR
ncbi:MAG: RDD family protein [Acidimicrobiales bacterium]